MSKKEFTLLTAAMVIMFLFGCQEPVKSMVVSTDNLNISRQVKSLDGTWEIIFDHDNAGRDAKWHLDKVFSTQNTRRNITVPSC